MSKDTRTFIPDEEYRRWGPEDDQCGAPLSGGLFCVLPELHDGCHSAKEHDENGDPERESPWDGEDKW